MLRTPGFCACVELSDTCRLSRADSGDKKSRISFFPSTPRPRRPSSFYHWQISESERNSDYCRAWAFAARAEAKSHVPVTATTVPLVPPAPCPPPSEYADLPGLACLAAAAECRQDEPDPRPTTLATGCATETGTAHVGTAHVGLQRHRRLPVLPGLRLLVRLAKSARRPCRSVTVPARQCVLLLRGGAAAAAPAMMIRLQPGDSDAAQGRAEPVIPLEGPSDGSALVVWPLTPWLIQ